MLRNVTAVATVGALLISAANAHAHFLFIKIVESAKDGRAAEVYFSDTATAGDAAYIDKIANTKLWLQTEAGKFRPLKVVEGEDRLSAALPKSGSLGVIGACTYGVLPRKTPFLLRHFPKAMAGSAAETNRLKRFDKAPVEITGTIKGGKMHLQAFRRGKPLPHAEIWTLAKDLSGGKMKCDAKGRVAWQPRRAGWYMVYFGDFRKEKGQYNGKKYQEVRNFATLSFHWTGATKQTSLLRKENLVAWCVVPFDAKKRGPAERAVMLKRLGFTKLAYDWRAQHVPTFETEIVELKKHGIEFFAFWGEHEAMFRLFEKHKIYPQVWRTIPNPGKGSQNDKVESAAKKMLPLVKRTKQLGCKLGLYNHGGWSGEPENMVAVCRWLHKNAGAKHVGIVYNFHHGHDHIADFGSALKQMKPFLLCVNLNGMNDGAKPKILPIGQGRHEKRMIEIIKNSGYSGPIGILDHRPNLDAEQSLRENLMGLKKIGY